MVISRVQANFRRARITASLVLSLLLVPLLFVPQTLRAAEGPPAAEGRPGEEADHADPAASQSTGATSSSGSVASPRRRAPLRRQAEGRRHLAGDYLEHRLEQADRESRLPPNVDRRRLSERKSAWEQSKTDLGEKAEAALTSSASSSSRISGLERHERYGSVVHEVNATRRALARYEAQLSSLHQSFHAGFDPDRADTGQVEMAASITAAMEALEREKASLRSTEDRILTRAARDAYAGTETRNDVKLRPLGAGANAPVFGGTPPRMDTEFAYKFESRFETADDAELAGFPPEFISATTRAHASWRVPEILGIRNPLIRANPVVLNGRPAQEMDLLTGYHEVIGKTYVTVPEDTDEGAKKAGDLRKHIRQQESLAEGYDRAPLSENDPYTEAREIQTARAQLVAARLHGNPAVVQELEETGPHPSLLGAGSAHGLNDPVLQERLNALQYVDLICGQIDRNLGNFLLRYTSAGATTERVEDVKGIDNNMSFGTYGEFSHEETNGQALGTLPRLPKSVDLEVAAAIVSLNSTQFRRALANDQSVELTAEQIEAAGQRYKLVRDHVRALVDAGNVVRSPALSDAEVAALKTKAGSRQVSIPTWGSAPGWTAFFHEESARRDADGTETPNPGSKDGSYMSRLAEATSNAGT